MPIINVTNKDDIAKKRRNKKKFKLNLDDDIEESNHRRDEWTVDFGSKDQ